VTLFLALFGAADGVWLARIPAVKQQLGLSDGVLGMALLASPAGVILVALVAGRLVDRVGSGLPTAVAGVLVPLLPIGFGLAGSLAELVAALLAFGLAAGLLDVAANVHALRVQRAYQRPLISSFHAWYSGGAIGGALLGGAFAWASVSPAVSFAAVGIPLAGVALLAARGLLRGREEGIPETGDSERALPPGARAGAGAAGRSRHVSLRLLVLGVLAMCSLLGEGAAGNWSAVYLHDNLAAPAGLAAIGFAAFSAAMTAGRMAGDRLAARFGPVRLMRGAGLLAAAGLGGGLLSGDPAGAIVGFAVFGAGLSVTFPQLMWAAADADPLRPGSAVARVAGMGYVGLLGGPVLIGGCATMAGLTRALTIPMVLMVGLALAARAVARPAADRAVARPADAPAG